MADAESRDSVSVPSRVEEAMARVRASLPGRRNGAPTPSPSPGERREAHALFPEDVYRSLHQARTIGGGIGVHYTVGWRTPVIGHLWMLVRRRIHAEIRIYIDALTQQQSNLNTHVVRVLTRAVEALDGLDLPALKRQQEEQAVLIEALRAEVRALQAQLGQLETRPPAPDARDRAETATRN